MPLPTTLAPRRNACAPHGVDDLAPPGLTLILNPAAERTRLSRIAQKRVTRRARAMARRPD
jgi:hypothetical protein